MKIDPHPAKPVHMITTNEGKFLSLEDMKDRMRDDGVIDLALAMLKVGRERGDGVRVAMRHALGSFVQSCAGEDHRRK